MKFLVKSFFVFNILLSVSCFGQQFSFSVMPHYSVGATLPPRYNMLAGNPFITPEIKTQYEGNLTNSNGTTTSYKLNNTGLGLSAIFKLTNQNSGNAWAVLVGVNSQNHILFFTSNLPFYTPVGGHTEYYENFRTKNISASLRKEFLVETESNFAWFLQLGGMYNIKTQTSHYVSGGWQNFKPETILYTQSGSGGILEYSSAPSKALVLVPEIGVLSKGKIGLEFSLSYQQPTVSSLYIMNASYYRNGRLSGMQEASISQRSLWLNAKLPIILFAPVKKARNYRTSKQPEKETNYANPPINVRPEPVPPSVIINGQVLKKGESIALNSIQFEQSKSDLLSEGKSALNSIVQLMKQYPTLVIELSGHTSNEDRDEDKNIRLSKERVAVCKQYIVNQLMDVSNRVKTVGHGSSKPRVPNNSDENRKKNRRVELKIESL